MIAINRASAGRFSPRYVRLQNARERDRAMQRHMQSTKLSFNEINSALFLVRSLVSIEDADKRQCIRFVFARLSPFANLAYLTKSVAHLTYTRSRKFEKVDFTCCKYLHHSLMFSQALERYFFMRFSLTQRLFLLIVSIDV